MTTVFYSWQKELPNSTNRGLIEKSLEDAVKGIREDGTLAVEPRLDADTQGVPGAPDIGATIFAKVKSAAVFVADVSLISRSTDENGRAVRQTPNPNVLIELGFAVGVLGWDRVLMVMNTHFGPVENLPFDLRMKKTITFNVSPDTENKAPIRKQLTGLLDRDLRLTLGQHEQKALLPNPFQAARKAIEEQTPPRAARIKDYMKGLLGQLDAVRPPSLPAGAEFEDALIAALDRTIPLVTEFGELSRVVSEYSDETALTAVIQGFEDIASSCFQGGRLSQDTYDNEYDFYRFVAHELFVCLVAVLLEHEQWGLLAQIGSARFFIKQNGKSENSPYAHLSQFVTTLEEKNKRQKTQFTLLRAEVLKDRHSKEPLQRVVYFERFMEADYYLYLRTELSAPQSPTLNFGLPLWRPYSLVHYSYQVPPFLTRSTSAAYGKNLATALGFSAMDALRKRLGERANNILKVVPSDYGLWQPGRFDPNTIGRSP